MDVIVAEDTKKHSFWLVPVRDAAIVVAACTVIALATNSVRGNGIPLVQQKPYQILVPCPATHGNATAVAPDSTLLTQPRVLVIDGREAHAYRTWHVARSRNIPFDYLDPTPAHLVNQVASSGAQAVVVYGDGNDPDSGEQLAQELSSKGIRNMHYVRGGAPAIRVSAKREGAQ